MGGEGDERLAVDERARAAGVHRGFGAFDAGVVDVGGGVTRVGLDEVLDGSEQRGLVVGGGAKEGAVDHGAGGVEKGVLTVNGSTPTSTEVVKRPFVTGTASLVLVEPIGKPPLGTVYRVKQRSAVPVRGWPPDWSWPW